MKNRKSIMLFSAVIVIAVTLFIYGKISAHCDTLDGPVVKASRDALETGNVNFVLIWVQKKDENEIRDIFEKTLAARKSGKEAQELADMYFFETVVRIHRAGEGASYTGLKPSGTDLGPVIPAGDRAIITGSIDSLKNLLTGEILSGLDKHYNEVIDKKNYDINNVDAGREYVKAYVEYLHYIERLHEAAVKPVGEHSEDSD